ncbi:MAG: hypothetical protein J6B05_00520 [Clostridia bacterium]|nr:hypothetical protein [Clostridia bacterium]MBO5334971.1 hypothetical protein [Clostridia bacterium]
MIFIVKCANHQWIQLPEGATAKKGDVVPCPAACAKYSSCFKKPQSKAIFIRTAESAEQVKIQTEEYSEQEKTAHFSGTSASGASSPSARDEGRLGSTHRAAVAATPSAPQVCDAPRTHAAGVSDESRRTADKYRRGRERSNVSFKGGAPTKTASETTTGSVVGKESQSHTAAGQRNEEYFTASIEASDSIYIDGKKRDGCFLLGGNVYSDDREVRAKRKGQMLKQALREIFRCWQTYQVFADDMGKKLSDKFVWLMVTCCKPRQIEKREVDEILGNPSYTVNQKFFYLFYDVIYFRTPPQAFYFPAQGEENGLSHLCSRFKDRTDFIQLYCAKGATGEYFRKEYQTLKREMLHYLKYEDESKLMHDIALLQAQSGYIVLLDKLSEGERSDYQPIMLGTIAEFISAMQYPQDVKRMEYMIRFLESYRINRYGEVSLREADEPFMKYGEDANVQEDDRMYRPLSLQGECARAYYCFISLFREYVKVFIPTRVHVGELTFDKYAYSDQLKEIVFEMCKTVFGNTQEKEKNEAIGRAWLAKNFYERQVLYGYVCEDRRAVEKVMKLAEDAVPEKQSQTNLADALRCYFELSETPMVRIDGHDESVDEYIRRLLSNDVVTVVSLFRQDIFVKTYVEVAVGGQKAENLSALFRELEKMYDDFVQR